MSDSKSEMKRLAFTNPTQIIQENLKLREQLDEARELIVLIRKLIDLKEGDRMDVCIQKQREAMAELEVYERKIVGYKT